MSSVWKRSAFSSKPKGRGSSNGRNGVHKIKESSDHHDLEKRKKHRDTDDADSRSGSIKKRKRRSVVGLAKWAAKNRKVTYSRVELDEVRFETLSHIESL